MRREDFTEARMNETGYDPLDELTYQISFELLMQQYLRHIVTIIRAYTYLNDIGSLALCYKIL